MRCAGFVLTGGSSSRMGRDKAQLPLGRGVLLDHVIQILQQVTSPVRTAGGSGEIPDQTPGFGPVEGIRAALAASDSDWNLILACDLPSVTPELLSAILDHGIRSEAICVVPRTPDGREHPLCAAYHRKALPIFTKAVADGIHKLQVVTHLAGVSLLDWPDTAPFQNLNTPAEWSAYLETVNAT